jgi:hypothetical protein
VAGANTRVTEYTDTKVSVSPFSDSYEAIKDVPIATVATAWDDPATGEVIVLYINEERATAVEHVVTARSWRESP